MISYQLKLETHQVRGSSPHKVLTEVQRLVRAKALARQPLQCMTLNFTGDGDYLAIVSVEAADAPGG